MHARTESEHIFDSREAMVEHMKAVVRKGMMGIPEETREPMVAAIVEAALASGMGRAVGADEAHAMLAEAVVLDD